ncbi:MAG: sel1 repeat family protein [Bacteroidales bacterium]|nr:sel1 repeat family protein [Bacteroidales bacterium]
MKKIIALFAFVMLFLTLNAQTPKEIYQAGKALYEAQKYNEAFVKFKSAAEQGNKKAQYYLGRCYAKGRGVAEDDKAAFEWYQKSANQDYAKAQYRLGKCYMKGKVVAKDEKKAAELFKKAVNNPKGGDEILSDLKKEASEGDTDAAKILKMIKN